MKRLLTLLMIAVLIISWNTPVLADEVPAIGTEEMNTVAVFTGLSDPNLHRYVEDSLYAGLVNALDSDSFFVENVDAVYISQEYLDELAYNSQANIFFGYTLAELEAEFQSAKYIFTLGEDGTTIVEPFQDYDDTYDKVLRNVAIGTGVILLCVTVSVVTAGAGAPAISVIFAASAKTGAIMALSGGAMGAASAGIITGIQTNDMNSAIKAAALAGSEGFKWGAITGAISGGASQAIKLKGATLSGLKMSEVATIQRESKYPLDVIKQFKTMDQYKICKDAGLVARMVKGKAALVRPVDLNFVDDFGRTNLQRMQSGLSALDPTGTPYELHHIGQKMDSTLAILSKSEHMQGGNNSIWHIFGEASEINRSTFAVQKSDFWKIMAETLVSGGV
ncbi:MAG: HNH/ENDO VII family nuclease [Christensenellales bacterium]